MKSFFFALILLIGSSLAFDSPVVCSMDADCVTVPTNNRRISCLFPGNAKGLGNTSDPRGFCAYVQNEKVLFIYKSELPKGANGLQQCGSYPNCGVGSCFFGSCS